MVLAGILGIQLNAGNNSTLPAHVDSVSALSQVFGDGAKVKTIVITYDEPIKNSSLKQGS